jgi:hypothetical protein
MQGRRSQRAARQRFILLLAACEWPTPLFTALSRRIEEPFFAYLISREPTKEQAG